LFNSRGEVIGLTTLQMKEGQNLNFAVPIEEIIGVVRIGRLGWSLSWKADKERWSRCPPTLLSGLAGIVKRSADISAYRS